MGTKGDRVEGPGVEDPADVANTCVAALALLRAGHTPCATASTVRSSAAASTSSSPASKRSDTESLYVTDLRCTQVQHKIGEYVDTFLTAMVLAEARGQMPDATGETRLSAVLDKVIDKIERHQQADGTWNLRGWVQVVGFGLASAGLNGAKHSPCEGIRRGAAVRREELARPVRPRLEVLRHGRLGGRGALHHRQPPGVEAEDGR